MANVIEVEARCRVEGLRDVSEDALCDLLEAAATEVERRVPEISPVVAIEGDLLTALGSFEVSVGRNSLDDAEGFAHGLRAGLRTALTTVQLTIAEFTTSTREELVPA